MLIIDINKSCEGIHDEIQKPQSHTRLLEGSSKKAQGKKERVKWMGQVQPRSAHPGRVAVRHLGYAHPHKPVWR
jgi:hypothetical protein